MRGGTSFELHTFPFSEGLSSDAMGNQDDMHCRVNWELKKEQ